MSIKDKVKKAARNVWAWLVAAALAVAAFFGYDADAQVVTDTVSWTLPTQRVDGSALPASEIAKTTIAWGTSQAGPFPNVQDVASPGTSHVFTRSSPGTGTRCYVGYVTDTEGRVGGQAGPVCKTVKAAPATVGGLTVQ